MLLTIDRIIRFSDGDTFVIPYYGEEAKVRVIAEHCGIDCPEMKGKCKKERRLAAKAKRFAREFVLDAHSVELDVGPELDYFKRLLAVVWCDGESLGDALLDAGLAKIYVRGKKSWC